VAWCFVPRRSATPIRLAPELPDLIAATRAETERALSLGGLRNDPIRYAFSALSVHLEALYRVLTDATLTIGSQLEAVQRAQPQFTAADVDAIARRLIQAFRPNIGDALRAMRVRTIACIVGIAAALFCGGMVIGGVGVWFWLDYVPTRYVYVVDQPGQQQHVAPR
jgi:hypothetical protein